MQHSAVDEITVTSLPDSESIDENVLRSLKNDLNRKIKKNGAKSSVKSLLWKHREKPEYLFQTPSNEIVFAQLTGEKIELTQLHVSYAGEEHWSLHSKKAFDNESPPFFEVLLIDDKTIVSHEAQPRHYWSTKLPTMVDAKYRPENFADTSKSKVLLKLYDQICDQYRDLADTRFKLLGLLPAVSVIVWTQLFKEELLNLPSLGLIIALLGLAVSIGIYIYNERNNELYNDLIRRGRKIEEELKIHTGLFRGRRRPHREMINHGRGTSLIYWSVFIGWFVIVLWFGATALNNLASSLLGIIF